MKKEVVLVLVLLVLPFVNACISYPRIEGKGCNIDFGGHYNNETAVLEILNQNKQECKLDGNEITILKDFIINGYSVKEQTEKEYSEFFGEIKEDNNKTGCVMVYTAVAYRGGWAGYIHDHKEKDEQGNFCPKLQCSGASINIIWNELLPLAESEVGCKTLYWFDDNNKECRQKEFCGMYAYPGLNTFQSKGQCEQNLNSDNLQEYCENWTLESGKIRVASSGNFEILNGRCKWKPASSTVIECREFWQIWGTNFQDCCNYLAEQKGIDKPFCKGKWVEDYDSYWQCAWECECPINSWNEDGKCMFNLSNGRKAQLKIMPETASKKAVERLGEIDFTTELKEVGKEDEVQVAYELSGGKQGKLFGIFKINGEVQAQVDAENGEVIKTKGPWWSFLASGI